MKKVTYTLLALTFAPLAAFANPCSNLRCSQAERAAIMVGEAHDKGLEVVLVVDGQPVDQPYSGNGSFCPGRHGDNNLGSIFEFNRRQVDPSFVYIDKKNLGTTIGCEHDQPATLP